MHNLSPFAALVTASLITITAENAWSDETAPNWPVPPGTQAPAPGWYPPPPGPYRVVPRVPSTVQNPLSARLEQARAQLAAKNRELDEVHAIFEQLRAMLERSLETEKALNQKVIALSRERDALQAQMTELTGKLNTAAELEQHRQKIANDQTQTQALSAERDRLRSELAGRDKQLSSLQAQLKTATQALQHAQSEGTTSSQALSDAKAEAETLKRQVADLTARLENQQTAQSEAEQSLGAERDQLRTELAGGDKQLNSLRAQLEAAKQALQQAQSETARSSQALGDAKAEAETLKSQVAALTARLESQQTAQSEAEQSLSAECDQLRTELAGRDKQLSSLQAQLNTATQALQQTQSETAMSRQALSDARAETETFKRQVADLTARLKTQQAELDTTRQRLQQAKTETAASIEATSDATAQTTADEGHEAAAAEIAALRTAGPDTDGDGITDAMDLCPETPQGAAVEPTGCVAGAAIDLDGVAFSDDGYELSDEVRRALDRVAEILRQHSDLRLQVVGHTDAQGDPAHNQWLSLQRAQTVRDYLVAQGVDARHIGAVGYGGQRPIADRATSEGQQTNQQVEIRSLR